MPDYNMRDRRKKIADKYMGGGEGDEATMTEEPGAVSDADLKAEMVDENTVKLTHPDGRVLEITKDGEYAQYFDMAMDLAKGSKEMEAEEAEEAKEEKAEDKEE